MDELERQGRIDLAAAFRWAARLGYNEAVANHFSLAVSEDGTKFLVNPAGRHFSELRASELLLVGADGALASSNGELDRTAYCIHSRIHVGLPHARCVLHTHMPHATALTAIEGGRLEPVHQNSLRFYDRVAYDDAYNALALEEEEGERICAALGNRSVLFLASHGVIVTGGSVATAFDALYYLERACETQILAMSTGRPLRRVPDHIARRTVQQWMECSDGEPGRLHFAALKRVLDREEPDYAE
jgi:ribulose-5-phosphate 4-epimerase/fuculose-1-phosphate aldolase